PLPLRDFAGIWVADCEYRSLHEEILEVHCLVATEVKSGRTIRVWKDKIDRLPGPPYPVGPGSLFVSYNLLAEFGAHLALGWPLTRVSLDLLIEFRMLVNGTDWREGEESRHKLVHALQYFGCNPLNAAEKKEMIELAKRGSPFNSEERRELLAYCERD